MSRPTDINSLKTALTNLPKYEMLRQRIENGQEAEVGGLSGGASSLLVATLADQFSRHLLLLTPGEREASERARELHQLYNQDTVKIPPYSSPEEENEEIPHSRSSRLSAIIELMNRRPNQTLQVCSLLSLMQTIPTPSSIDQVHHTLSTGDSLERDPFIDELVDRGYTRTDRVVMAGEFSARGGILDLFPEGTEAPVRLEFFGDELSSIRSFDPGTQESREHREQVTFTLVNRNVLHEQMDVRPGPSLMDLLDGDPLTIWLEPNRILQKLNKMKRYHDDESTHERFAELSMHPAFEQRIGLSSVALSDDEQAINVQCGSLSSLGDTEDRVEERLRTISDEAESVLVACPTAGEEQRLQELMVDRELPFGERIQTVRGPLSSGFLWPALDTAVAGRDHHDVEADPSGQLQSQAAGTRPIDDFLELKPGDYVVHEDHGIARFGGIKTVQKDGEERDVLKLFFKNSVLLEVPETQVHRVQKYLGAGKGEPTLSKLGGDRWQKKKRDVSESIRELGKELIELQAVREKGTGHACRPDTEWQAEFEAAFPHRETPDQERINAMIKKKMESPTPMDLLLTGDVGFGKTELAMRAAFKMVMEGKQVAMMTPTTVLTQQHVRTFRERMGPYPMQIEPMSRFQTGSEQREVIDNLQSGSTDIVIGTHRLLSDDITFDDLGLVIIDEEQRFGVEHKQKLKRLRATVDVLTMTATPIPRSLHMALLGIRDIATLRTPPEGRQNIQTNVIPYKKSKIRDALVREIERDGQAYYLHNRVKTIERVREKVQDLLPDATVRVAHGQMKKANLKQVMSDFYEEKVDVLVCTTIIESGLDQKNVNTLIVENADRFGLADLHQLRGRIGRHQRRGYAYFVLPRNRSITPVARRRLEAIEKHSELGAGFKVAMRDLEIRGAGRILGKKQSGHIDKVGYDLYCKLLEREMKKLKDEDLPPAPDPSIKLSMNVRIPDEYAGNEKNRMRLYRRFGRCDSEKELDSLLDELEDRYGQEIPDPVRNLARQTRLRLRAASLGIRTISEGNDLFILRFNDEARIQPLLDRYPDRVRRAGDDRLYVYERTGQVEEQDHLKELLELLEDVSEPHLASTAS